MPYPAKMLVTILFSIPAFCILLIIYEETKEKPKTPIASLEERVDALEERFQLIEDNLMASFFYDRSREILPIPTPFIAGPVNGTTAPVWVHSSTFYIYHE